MGLSEPEASEYLKTDDNQNKQKLQNQTREKFPLQ
jgi:hypothetical protein